MKSSVINSIRFDSMEINCQAIFDGLVAFECEFDENPEYEKYLKESFEDIEALLLEVNDIELFPEMISLIFRFKNRYRWLKHQFDIIEDEEIRNSSDLANVLSELSKFSEII